MTSFQLKGLKRCLVDDNEPSLLKLPKAAEACFSDDCSTEKKDRTGKIEDLIVSSGLTSGYFGH